MDINKYIEKISQNFKLGIRTETERYLVINTGIIKQISEKLQLGFINEEEMERLGEVCFANSPEIRPEFRLTFTSKDVLDYLYAILYSTQFHKDFEKYLKTDLKSLPIPADIFTFCKMAVLGSELQKTHRLENPLLQLDGNTMESERIIKEIDTLLNAK